MAYQCLVNSRCYPFRTAVLSLLKTDRGHALEGRAVETDAIYCLDRGAGSGCWLGIIGFLAGNARFLQELIHDVSVGPFTTCFLAEILRRYRQQSCLVRF